ncbi:MAG: substrate-binding domain-containing protein [Chitinophagales bacterium]|nr:substrate-binding domain-containing protein [Chitinophagales bacterium]MDW8418943.1 substrate-binding domain-containing protein [Chitinophagales bacterium]
MRSSYCLLLPWVVLWFVCACNNPSAQHKGGSATPYGDAGRHKTYKGEVKVFADYSLAPVLRQHKEVFEYLYDSVKLNISYTFGDDALDSFRQQKNSVLIITRALLASEKEQMKNRDTLYPREVMVCYDAVALIAGIKSPFSYFDVDDLRKLFTAGAGDKIKLVFEHQKSGAVTQVLNAMGFNGKPTDRLYALHSADEVIQYCTRQTDAVGFVPFAMLSDNDDPNVQKMLTQVKILSLRLQNEKGETVMASATQSDIAAGVYPLARPVYAIIRYGHGDSPAWLFVNFLYREKGARIFLKAGLVPARMPERQINVNTGPLEVIP